MGSYSTPLLHHFYWLNNLSTSRDDSPSGSSLWYTDVDVWTSGSLRVLQMFSRKWEVFLLLLFIVLFWLNYSSTGRDDSSSGSSLWYTDVDMWTSGSLRVLQVFSGKCILYFSSSTTCFAQRLTNRKYQLGSCITMMGWQLKLLLVATDPS